MSDKLRHAAWWDKQVAKADVRFETARDILAWAQLLSGEDDDCPSTSNPGGVSDREVAERLLRGWKLTE